MRREHPPHNRPRVLPQSVPRRGTPISLHSYSGEITAHQYRSVMDAAGDHIRDIAASRQFGLEFRGKSRELAGSGRVRVEQIREPDPPLILLDGSHTFHIRAGDAGQLVSRHVQPALGGRIWLPAPEQARHPVAHTFERIGYGSRHHRVGRQLPQIGYVHANLIVEA
jgi:hypothetical protein